MASLSHRPSLVSFVGSALPPKSPRPFAEGLIPDGPYFDELPELPDSLWYEPETDDPTDAEPATGDVYWTEELEHLEGLLPLATPLRRAEVERRIDGILAMLGLPAPARKPRLYEPDAPDRLWWALETERLAAESFERQMAEAWTMAEIEAGAERFDGRYTDEDMANVGACG